MSEGSKSVQIGEKWPWSV